MSDTVARCNVSEIGVDMSHFPTVGHAISWAGLCPRNDESGGKQSSTRMHTSGAWIKTILMQAAWTTVRKKDSYLNAQFVRLKSRRGAKKGIIAVAASILTAAYHMLRDGTEYADLGASYFGRVDEAKVAARLVRKLKTLGYEVEVKKAA